MHSMQSALAPYLAERGRKLSLAHLVGVNRSTVTRWSRGRVPAERVALVSEITGIPRERLRPDLFAPPDITHVHTHESERAA